MPYYHILLLLVYHGIKTNQQVFINHAMLLILMKLWNGRKSEFIKYCDARIMRYVTSNLVSNKHLIAKYDTPLSLLTNHFTPTIISKYAPEINKDPDKLKNLFSQSWARIRQLFSQNPKISPTTGKKEAQGGIAPLYYKAHKEGLSVVSPTIYVGDEDEEAGYSQYATTHIRDEISQSTTDYIVMNTNPAYPATMISSINRITKVSSKVLEQIFVSIHNHKYHDYIHDLFTLMLGKLNVAEKGDICKSSFMLDVKKKIISSKNNPEAKKIQKILDIILSDIFKNKLSLNFDNYSNVQKIQIRTSLVHAIIYNLRKNICHGQVVGLST